MEKNHTIGKKIKEAREQKRLSQKKFAKLLNVSQASVSKYESGENIPRMKKLRQISSILEFPLSYFIDETIDEYKEKDKGSTTQERKKEIISVIHEFWGELGLHEKKEAILDEPLIRFCISRIETGSYNTTRQLQIIRLLKLIEEISHPQN